MLRSGTFWYSRACGNVSAPTKHRLDLIMLLGSYSQFTPARFLAVCLAPYELAETLPADKPSISYDTSAAHHRKLRPSSDIEALIRRVIRGVLQQHVGEFHLLLRIPDSNICIRPDCDRAFARVEAVGLGMIGRGQRDKRWED